MNNKGERKRERGKNISERELGNKEDEKDEGIEIELELELVERGNRLLGIINSLMRRDQDELQEELIETRERLRHLIHECRARVEMESSMDHKKKILIKSDDVCDNERRCGKYMGLMEDFIRITEEREKRLLQQRLTVRNLERKMREIVRREISENREHMQQKGKADK